MNENRSLLDYITFDEWNKITSEFLENELSSRNQDELERVFKEQSIEEISRESYDNLSDDRKLFLVLYGCHNFISGETEPKDSFNSLLQQCEKFRSKDELELLEALRIYLTYLTYKAFLALLEKKEKTQDYDALMLLSKQLPVNVKKIRVMIPLVPIKSTFTMYITSLLVSLIRNLSKDSKVEYKINIGWNEIAYGKIRENMENHLCFDEKLFIKDLQPLIEQNFLTFMYYLITSSQWKIPDEEKRKIENLRKNFETVKYDLPPPDEVPSPIAKAGEKLLDICRIILQDLGDYIPDQSPHLVEYYGKIIFDACSKLEDGEHILFITPLPVGLIMDCLFHYIQAKGLGQDENYTRACQSVHYLCYLPFPGSEDIRHEIPFYLTEYSYFLYKPHEGIELKKIFPKRNYIRRLLVGAIKILDLKSEEITLLDRKDYHEIVSMITSIFRREDNRQKEYIRYV